MSVHHDKVSRELAELEQPVIIVIDDIDRLTTIEIRDIFKLVRLTASFPNLIYILAFDREKVEAALEDVNVPGRLYLEKIIQVVFDLPETPGELLMSEVFNELRTLMDAVGIEKLDTSRWSDIFLEIIYPLIGNMRDIARLSLSARPTLRALGTAVEGVDLLAMEAIRVFRPEVFGQLRRMRSALTQTGDNLGSSDMIEGHQSQIDQLFEIAKVDIDLIKALLARLFPAATKYFANNHYGSEGPTAWRKQHRMASNEFLAMYFDRVAPSELQSFRIAESLVSAMSHPEQFARELGLVPAKMLPDVLYAMESFQGDFFEEGVVSAIASLLNTIPKVPQDEQRTGGLFALRPEVIVMLVILRMLEQVEAGVHREAIVDSAVSEVHSYSSKLKFVQAVGHLENNGSKMISKEAAQRLETHLFDEITATPPSKFSNEWDLARVFSFIGEQSGNPAVLAEERRPDAVRAILESVKSENRSQVVGSRHVRSTPVLAWEWLVSLYGSEGNLRNAVEALREVDGETEIVKLTDKYLSG